MPRKKQPEDTSPTASEILDAWQKMVHEQLLNPERIADWLGTANNLHKAPHDRSTKHAPSPVSEHDAIAELKQHVAKLERRIRKLESALDANAKPNDAAKKPRRRVAKSAAKSASKPKRTTKRTTKK